MADLRESGSIEQDADVVLFLYREDYYKEDTDRQDIVDVMVAKNRSGATNVRGFPLLFRKKYSQFRTTDDPAHEPKESDLEDLD